MKVKNWETLHEKELHDRYEAKRGVSDDLRGQLATCERKYTHSLKKEAKAESERMQSKFPQYKYSHYRCNICGKWHVGRI